VQRKTRKSPIRDAKNPECPAPDEIDLRFRCEIGGLSNSPDVASMAICYLGGKSDERHCRGAVALGRAMRRDGTGALWVSDAVSISPELGHYDLVYLVGLGKFTMDKDEMVALHDYIQNGGTVFVESCRQKASKELLSDSAFFDVLGSMNIKLEDVPSGHPLLTDPYLFASATPGFAVEEEPKLLVSGGVVFSSHDYGCMWQGEQHGGSPSREAIRAAHEWGSNLVAYALRRRREVER
jgi:hypothetical protein